MAGPAWSVVVDTVAATFAGNRFQKKFLALLFSSSSKAQANQDGTVQLTPPLYTRLLLVPVVGQYF